MAYSEEIWAKARYIFEHEGKSLNQIHKELGISKGALSERSKTEQWKFNKNQEYIKEKVSVIIESEHLNEKVNKLSEQANNIVNTDGKNAIISANKRAYEEAEKRLEIEGTQMKVVQKIDALLEKGKLTKKVMNKEGQLVDEEEELDMFQYKAAADALDKASVTVNINKRHANTVINNNNGQQNMSIDTVNALILSYKQKNGKNE